MVTNNFRPSFCRMYEVESLEGANASRVTTDLLWLSSASALQETEVKTPKSSMTRASMLKSLRFLGFIFWSGERYSVKVFSSKVKLWRSSKLSAFIKVEMSENVKKVWVTVESDVSTCVEKARVSPFLVFLGRSTHSGSVNGRAKTKPITAVVLQMHETKWLEMKLDYDKEREEWEHELSPPTFFFLFETQSTDVVVTFFFSP